MDKQIAMQWVAALRSGDYKQGSGRLRFDNEFCCLGVLCNLHAQAHPKIAARETIPTLYLDNSAYLPDEVKKWAKISTTAGGCHFKTPGVKKVYAGLDNANDDGVSFKHIANFIEANYAAL